MLEAIHVMFVRVDVLAGAQCQTRPFLFHAGGSHRAFVACLSGSVPKHAAASFVVLPLNLESGCAAFGRQPLCNRSLALVTDVPCLCVCV